MNADERLTVCNMGFVGLGTDQHQALNIRALSRVRAELEREFGADWVTAELQAGAILTDVCDQLGLTGRQRREALGDVGARYAASLG